MLNVGFTGTQLGMTESQKKTLFYLFKELGVTRLNHGDCIGADQEAHDLAVAGDPDVYTVGHPSMYPRKRAYCKTSDTRTPLPPLRRNKVIVSEGRDGLIAAPGTRFEITRSGTWSTVRLARKMGRTIWIVYPDGSVSKELPNAQDPL